MTERRYLNGRELSRLMKKARMTSSMRALFAYDSVAGRFLIHDLTRAQAAKLFSINTAYIDAVGQLKPAERKLIETGAATLSSFHNRRLLARRKVEQAAAKELQPAATNSQIARTLGCGTAEPDPWPDLPPILRGGAP